MWTILWLVLFRISHAKCALISQNGGSALPACVIDLHSVLPELYDNVKQLHNIKTYHHDSFRIDNIMVLGLLNALENTASVTLPSPLLPKHGYRTLPIK